MHEDTSKCESSEDDEILWTNNLSSYLDLLNQDFVLNFRKNFDENQKKNSKIINFTSKWEFEEVLSDVSRLDAKKYPRLFIFIVEVRPQNDKNFKPFIKNLQNILIKFITNRPLFLHISSKEENSSKFFYKTLNSNEFIKIEPQNPHFDDVTDFPTFFHSINADFKSTIDSIMQKLSNIKDSSIILRFLKSLSINDEKFKVLLQNCAAKGSKSDILAILDVPFDYDWKYGIENELVLKSVMETALEHSNISVLDLFTKESCQFLRNLSYESKIEISTFAYSKNHFQTLCDLLEFCDFPFPKDFQSESTNHARLKDICKNRMDLHQAIASNDTNLVNKFINDNPNIKIAFNPQNVTALHQASLSKSFEIFFKLQSLGFQALESVDLDIKSHSYEHRRKIRECGAEQREVNKKHALTIEKRTIKLLSTRTKIHNKRIPKQIEDEYWKKIKEWYNDLYESERIKTVFDVVVQCDDMTVMFDFESKYTKDMDFESQKGTLGKADMAFKCVFIGAKFSTIEEEQMIKGTIAHELSHYAVQLVFENDLKPYYRGSIDVAKLYYDVIAEHAKWGFKDPKPISDNCNEIISRVYRFYQGIQQQQELIVRVLEIIAYYDKNVLKIQQLEQEYASIFDYFDKFVAPEFKKFNLKNRQLVREFNKSAGLVDKVKNLQLKIQFPKDLSILLANKVSIVSTNVIKLFLLDAYANLCPNGSNLFDTQNIIISDEVLSTWCPGPKPDIWNKFSDILKEKLMLNVFIDCSKGTTFDLLWMKDCKNMNFIYINPKFRLLPEETMKYVMEYHFNDLNVGSQKMLLDRNITFQEKSRFSLLDLLEIEDYSRLPTESRENSKSSIKSNEQKKILLKSSENPSELVGTATKQLKNPKKLKNLSTKSSKNYSNFDIINFDTLIDNELLNMLVNELSIKISTETAKTPDNDKFFDPIYHTRNYIRVHKDPQVKATMVPEEEFFLEVKNKSHVLISDIAGNGKSWALKKMRNKMKEKYPKRWTTYVDLKLFIEELKEIKVEKSVEVKKNSSATVNNSSELTGTSKNTLDFPTFMAENVLKLKSQFQARLFIEMYKIGRTTVLFDGYDEIAPDYSKVLINLVKTFNSNDGNQLWIASRDYFEKDLLKVLDLNISYRLESFKPEDGAELIASLWILDEISELKSQDDIKNHKNYKQYLKDAANLVQKMHRPYDDNKNPIGYPQFFKMIAIAYKTEKITTDKITEYKIYNKCVKIHYERWAYNKGELRKSANIEMTDKSMQFHGLHEFQAIKAFYVKITSICDLEFDESAWTDDEIIACGVLNKSNGKFFFPHQTFQEYFVAFFIVRILKRKERIVDEDFCNILIDTFTWNRFEVVRMFLNEALAECTGKVYDKIEAKIPDIADYFCRQKEPIQNLSFTFEENYEKLADMLIKIFQKGDCDRIKIVFMENSRMLPKSARHPNLSLKLLHFLLGSKDEYAQLLINKPDNVGKLSEAVLNCSELVGTFLESANNSWELVGSSSESVVNFSDSFVNSSDFASNSSNFASNSLNSPSNTPESINNPLNPFQNTSETTTAPPSPSIFTSDEIFELLMKDYDFEDNMIHLLIQYSTIDDIRSIFEILKQKLGIKRFHKILQTNGFDSRNLFHIAAVYSKDIKIHQFLWQTYRENFPSEAEFRTYPMQIDGGNGTIFHTAAPHATKEIFEFLIKKIEKIASKDEIRWMLLKIGFSDQNVLQAAVYFNESIELHETLWKIIGSYLNEAEILNMIKHIDEDHNNLLENAFERNTKAVAELTWKKIKVYLNKIEDQKEYWKRIEKNKKNLVKIKNSEVRDWVESLLDEYK